MKASKQRKMMKAIASSKGLRHKESARITRAQEKVFENYDACKAYRNWLQENRTAMAFAGRSV